jgi:hypothetical protein
LKVDNSKLVVGDLENNGRIRIEIFNQYGSTGSNPGINQAQIKFTKNMVVTFRLSGLTDNMKEGAGSHVAGLEYGEGFRFQERPYSLFLGNGSHHRC